MTHTARWGLPASSLAVAAFFAAALLPRATWPLVDPDVWWHIRAGESVLSTGTVPRVDTWSIAGAGSSVDEPGLAGQRGAWRWAIAWGQWGETLLSLLFAGLAVTAFAILWRAMADRQPGIGWLSRVVWLSAGLLLAGPTLGVRVQVLDLLMTALVVAHIWAYTARPRRRYLLGLVLIAVLWVNLHAGWPLLFIVGGATVLGELVDGRLRPDLQPRPLAPRAVGWLAGTLVVCAAVLALNPNGIDIYRYPLDTLGLGTLKAAIGEWQPASLDNLFGWLLLGFVLLGVAPTFLLAWRRLRLADAVVLAGLTAMSVLAIRFLLVLGPVGGSIVALNLGPDPRPSREWAAGGAQRSPAWPRRVAAPFWSGSSGSWWWPARPLTAASAARPPRRRRSPPSSPSTPWPGCRRTRKGRGSSTSTSGAATSA